tara:strand:- start:790 stop:1005 length:216 start_codon:yes stop_codon:yes gene_type:complete
MAYKIRLGGTNEFVSRIVPDWPRAHPPGIVYFVKGWDNPEAKIWENLKDAKIAEKEVWDIEGFHTSIEKVL